jgi:hypothetical protein
LENIGEDVMPAGGNSGISPAPSPAPAKNALSYSQEFPDFDQAIFSRHFF